MIKNILVYGIGGVGGYFGGMLAHAGERFHTSFIARGTHLASIQKTGLILDTDNEKGLVCPPDLAVEKPEEAPSADLCIIAVKGYDLDEVSTQLADYINEDTVILPLLNGVDIRERIRKHVHIGTVLPACVYVSANIASPGRVEQRGPAGRVVAGKDPEHPEKAIDDISELFTQAGLGFSIENDPYPAIWQKFLFIAAYGLVTAWKTKNFGELLADPGLVQTTEDIISEAAAVARIKGINLAETAEKTAIKAGRKFPPETRTSFQRDVESDRSKNEGDLFGGAILRLGRELGVPTPVTERVYAEITAGSR